MEMKGKLGKSLEKKKGKIRYGVAWRMPRGENPLIY